MLGEVARQTGTTLEVITPADADSRGCQLSVIIHGHSRGLVEALSARGVITDWREPNVMRLAPVPMYNSFSDITTFGEIFSNLLLT